MGSRRDPRFFYGVVASIVALVAVVVIAIVAIEDGRVLPGCEFDDLKWTAAMAEDDPNRRFELAEPEVTDIVKCDDLIYGMSEQDVDARLGRRDGGSGGTWFYDVGVPEGLSDYESLTIVFEDGGVVEASVPGYIEP